MPLPWVRLDTNVSTHDKFLNLLSDPSAKKWQAAASYFFALSWSGGHETDGKVPAAALSFVHGTTTTARLLVKYDLWNEGVNGWEIRNYSERQQLSHETYQVRKAQSEGGKKGACMTNHGKDCGCWRN